MYILWLFAFALALVALAPLAVRPTDRADVCTNADDSANTLRGLRG